MGYHDQRRKVLQAKSDRWARTGENAATDRAKRLADKKARAKANKPFQDRLNRYHAAWVAAGMPSQNFPNMYEWEIQQAAITH